ncbi:hypothetical protein TanjilG_00902 [Lupinus angustifolius]|uniref:PARP catalytic domain-containing protein n=1 Tax=Lupinus angustifolius TaxID=3871 RepID=A0A4P1QQV7_LUPAN|nr:PREDICTED: uncharacterized protein LOC109332240 [Lupinus angustifolius]OIV92768.1 hypothetical protein TanjilG_00902 [Lupinus angustifolius]
MASGWVKSLQCKSKAFEDVYHPNAKHLKPTASCRNTIQNIKDVVDKTTTKPDSKKPKPKPKPRVPLQKHPSSRYPTTNKSEFESPARTTTINRSQSSAVITDRTPAAAEARFPSLTEVKEGHPSRNVLEIIFHTSWGPKPFLGRVEMIFKVHNAPRTVSRFEEYREAVKNRSGSGSPTRGGSWEENARCVADGNEVMRFHCLGPTSSGGPYGGACAWSFPGGKGSAVCTFSGSGGAHESSGGGRGTRAMLVCRVIAGRVSKQEGFMDSLLEGRVGFDSVSGDNGELFVFESRAVLPCFLIIYKL